MHPNDIERESGNVFVFTLYLLKRKTENSV